LNHSRVFGVIFQNLTLLLIGELGLARGYASEKQSADEQISALEEKKESLIVRLDRAEERLRELEEGRNDLLHREDDLTRQRQAIQMSMGDREQGESFNKNTYIKKFVLNF